MLSSGHGWGHGFRAASGADPTTPPRAKPAPVINLNTGAPAPKRAAMPLQAGGLRPAARRQWSRNGLATANQFVSDRRWLSTGRGWGRVLSQAQTQAADMVTPAARGAAVPGEMPTPASRSRSGRLARSSLPPPQRRWTNHGAVKTDEACPIEVDEWRTPGTAPELGFGKIYGTVSSSEPSRSGTGPRSSSASRRVSIAHSLALE